MLYLTFIRWHILRRLGVIEMFFEGFIAWTIHEMSQFSQINVLYKLFHCFKTHKIWVLYIQVRAYQWNNIIFDWNSIITPCCQISWKIKTTTFIKLLRRIGYTFLVYVTEKVATIFLQTYIIGIKKVQSV